MENDIITLKPNTKRLKQLIKEFGDQWEVKCREESAPCFNGKPGLFIESITTNKNGFKHSRWITEEDYTL